MSKKDKKENKNAEKENKGAFSFVKEWVGILVTALIIAGVVVQFVRPTRVDGESMLSTLQDRDYLIVNTIKYRLGDPKRGDIIIFDTDMPLDGYSDLSVETRNPLRRAMDFILHDDSRGKDLVKRVIGVGGDHIQISNGEVRVNGEVIDEPYLDEGMYTEGDVDVVVPEGKVFAMGDNRVNSLDSRFPEVGLIDEKDIMGHVMLRLFPMSSFGFVD